jgi:hypothetical protein
MPSIEEACLVICKELMSIIRERNIYQFEAYVDPTQSYDAVFRAENYRICTSKAERAYPS